MRVGNLKRVIINQIGNIGDLVLTLPMFAVIKQHYPSCEVILLARTYTKALADSYQYIDGFIDWESIQSLPNKEIIEQLQQINADAIIHTCKDRKIARLAHLAKIPLRIGTSQRINHWWHCNRMVNIARRYSSLHEAAINIKLLRAIGIKADLDEKTLIPLYQFRPGPPLPSWLGQIIDPKRFMLILHPGSNGHGREWPPIHFTNLINQLPQDQWQVFITGTAREEIIFSRSIFAKCPQVINLVGQLSLPELMTFIRQADGLVASGTGPLHLAAAFGIPTLGLFPPRNGISPKRWAPLGKQGEYLVHERKIINMCLACTNATDCSCMYKISVNEVQAVLQRWLGKVKSSHRACTTQVIPKAEETIA